MTSAISNSDRAARLRGFTLTELLTVMGIIIILVGILIPTIIRAYANADRTRTAADIQAIGMALDAYRADFGDIPRIDRTLVTNGMGTGAAVLCKALIGPGGNLYSPTPGVFVDEYASASWTGLSTTTYSYGDYVYDPNSGTTPLATYVCVSASNVAGNVALSSAGKWTQFSFLDGNTGPGFKLRRDPGTDKILFNGDDAVTGKTWGPYLQIDRFKIQGSGTSEPGMGLADLDGHVFLYYPTSVVRPNISPAAAVTSTTGGGYCFGYYAGKPLPLYCSTDNEGQMTVNELQLLLGDYGADGRIDAPPISTTLTGLGCIETSVGYYAYLIISPGPDGAYGPTPVVANAATLANWTKNKNSAAACDDIANFPR